MRLEGLIAAAHTPFRQDGSLDLTRIEALAGRFVRDGLSGAFVCGTTGEFPSLTIEERIRVTQRWCEVARSSLHVVAHVGSSCIADARRLAAESERAGAAAISAVAPYYFAIESLADLVDCCAEIAAAAPALPFYYYHIPALSRASFSMREFLERAVERVPTLAGIKFSAVDPLELGRCVELGGDRLQFLYGSDETLLAGLAVGAHGAVGTTYSFAAPLYRRLLEAFDRGDLPEARTHQLRSMEMVTVFARFRTHPAMKAAMRVTGLDVGPPRLPQRRLDDSELRALEAALGEIRFDTFCSPPPG